MTFSSLPALDVHAHVAPDVMPRQITALGNAVVFAMTRSLSEAVLVQSLSDGTLVWGVGVHPRLAAAREGWDPDRFRELLHSFALVGEVGLDRRGGDWTRQREIFEEVLVAVRNESVLVSVHSSGAASEVVQQLCDSDVRGGILHWFNGDLSETRKALDIGCYFSVNAAMTQEQIRYLPRDRVLCETDFPARKVRASKPGDVAGVELVLSRAWGISPAQVRAATWWNLRTLSEQTGAIERLPEAVADTLLYL